MAIPMVEPVNQLVLPAQPFVRWAEAGRYDLLTGNTVESEFRIRANSGSKTAKPPVSAMYSLCKLSG